MFKNLKLKQVGLIFSLAFALIGLMSVISIIIIESNVSLVRDSWRTYQIDRSDKAKLTSTLQAELGYGGVIHQFKNFILRAKPKYFESAKAKLIETNATIEQFNSLVLTESEQISLENIQITFDRYQKQLNLAKEAFSQGKTSQQVDKLVYVDDGLAIRGLETLIEEQNKAQKTANLDRKKSKYRLIVSLRYKMGYDGFIHHFKNAILRSDLGKLKIAKEKLQESLLLLTEYETLELTKIESSALQNIRKTLELYHQEINNVHQLTIEKRLPSEIDGQVAVNDKAALEGFLTLDKEIYVLTQARSKEVYEVLEFLTNLVDRLTMIIISITKSLITFSLWLIRFRLISPITHLINNMKKLAKGDFTVAIKLAERQKENEIGEMARSIEIFRESAQKRQEVETKIKTVLKSALDGIITINDKGLITSFNPAAEKIFGYTEQFVMGKNVALLMPEPHKSKHDKYVRDSVEGKPARIMGAIIQQQAIRKDGVIFPVEISLNEMWIKDRKFFTAIIRDITERVKNESEIKKMALYDPLTGIANRYQFETKLAEAASGALRTKKSVGLVLIDLDKFKPVNDNYGHLTGDLLLKEVSARLNAAKRETDTVARVGGDEFAIILNHLDSKHCALIAIKRYQKSLNEPYIIEGFNLDVGASFGLSIFPEDETNLDELYRIADNAMYQEKAKPKSKQ